MDQKEDLKFLYSGTEINASVLKNMLEENKIPALIRNDMKSGLAAGFGGSLSGFAAKVYVEEKDLNRAKKILEEFIESMEKE
ncbi:MAG: DUF2007 domain-containing protein [Bacteroidales bacterium]|jgi:hypothetical protein|nr:DUF2007 domain-containing protein [Bacteroidales bacterium]